MLAYNRLTLQAPVLPFLPVRAWGLASYVNPGRVSTVINEQVDAHAHQVVHQLLSSDALTPVHAFIYGTWVERFLILSAKSVLFFEKHYTLDFLFTECILYLP